MLCTLCCIFERVSDVPRMLGAVDRLLLLTRAQPEPDVLSAAEVRPQHCTSGRLEARALLELQPLDEATSPAERALVHPRAWRLVGCRRVVERPHAHCGAGPHCVRRRRARCPRGFALLTPRSCADEGFSKLGPQAAARIRFDEQGGRIRGAAAVRVRVLAKCAQRAAERLARGCAAPRRSQRDR